MLVLRLVARSSSCLLVGCFRWRCEGESHQLLSYLILSHPMHLELLEGGEYALAVWDRRNELDWDWNRLARTA